MPAWVRSHGWGRTPVSLAWGGWCLQAVHAVAVAFADRDGRTVDLDLFGGVGVDATNSRYKGAVDAFEEVKGQEGFDLGRAHFGYEFVFGGHDPDVFALA